MLGRRRDLATKDLAGRAFRQRFDDPHLARILCSHAPGAVGSLIVAAGLLAARGTTGNATQTEMTSGIRGVTVVDGGCPVIREGSPCPDRPIAAHLIVTASASRAVVERVDTDARGRFRVLLVPGRYVVRAANMTGAIMPAVGEVDVTVTAARIGFLVIHFDSCIR